MELCKYGCGNPVTHKDRCSAHWSSCPALRAKNSKSLKQAHQDGKLPGWTDECRASSNKDAIANAVDKCFKRNSGYTTASAKGYMYGELNIAHECNMCGITKWNNSDIILELDHIDGDSKNNELTNLRLLCPNCHSQTPTWRGRNINNGKAKVSDKELLTALKSSANIRQALIEVGLAPKGANYIRANKLKDILGS